MNRDRILQICESYENYKEGPKDNETIFNKWWGVDFIPWCCTSVSEILYEAGNPLPKIQTPGPGVGPEVTGAAFVPYVYDYYKKRGKGITVDPQKGDLAIFDWNHDKSGDHIGFFIGWTDGTKKSFQTWEGNTSPTSDSNGGQFMRRVRYISQVLCFINPDNEL